VTEHQQFIIDSNHPRLIKPLLLEDLSKTLASIGVSSSLSKPSFCPISDGKYRKVVVGTEDLDYTRNSNKLIFFQLEENKLCCSENGVPLVSTYHLEMHVRDVHWIDLQHIVFAQGHRIGLCRVGSDNNVEEIINFPEFHQDWIRELAVCPRDNRYVLSGGFDGKVFVTDIFKLATDIQKGEKKSENSLYPCNEVVGSVAWHPTDNFLASCTTDPGTLHLFDVRTDKRRPAIVSDTGKKELYTHAYRDENIILLGYGDGKIGLFDIRSQKPMLIFQDPIQKAIGDFRVDFKSKSFATFGIPEVTVWVYGDFSFQLCGRHAVGAAIKDSTHPNTHNHNRSQQQQLQQQSQPQQQEQELQAPPLSQQESQLPPPQPPPPPSQSQLQTTPIPQYKTAGEFIKDTSLFGVTDSLGTFALFDFTNLQLSSSN
jgi:WD40 repeat protein